jgi:hypothetical protein
MKDIIKNYLKDNKFLSHEEQFLNYIKTLKIVYNELYNTYEYYNNKNKLIIIRFDNIKHFYVITNPDNLDFIKKLKIVEFNQEYLNYHITLNIRDILNYFFDYILNYFFDYIECDKKFYIIGKNNLYGIIDNNFKLILPIIYTKIEGHCLFIVTKNQDNTNSIFNFNGKMLFENIDLLFIHNNFFQIFDNTDNTYKLFSYNKKLNLLSNTPYKILNYITNNCFLISDSENNNSIFNSDLNKILLDFDKYDYINNRYDKYITLKTADEKNNILISNDNTVKILNNYICYDFEENYIIYENNLNIKIVNTNNAELITEQQFYKRSEIDNFIDSIQFKRLLKLNFIEKEKGV